VIKGTLLADRAGLNMVRDTPENLFQRRQRLLLRSTELRVAIAAQSQVLKTPLALGDQVRAGLQWLYLHPAWPLGALVALLVGRPQRALRWGGRVWWAWITLRRVQGWLSARRL
jgi:hypothetical protein